MNNQNAGGQPPRPPDTGSLTSLIKPEQVMRIPTHIVDEQNKAKFHTGVSNLWRALNSSPQGTPEWQQSYTRLQQIGQHIRQIVQSKSQQRDPNQQNGIPQQAPGQQQPSLNTMQQPQQQTQQPQPPPQPQQQNQAMQQAQTGVQNSANRPMNQNFSAKVLEKIKTQVYVAPASIRAHGNQRVSVYLQEVKMKHAQALQKYENAIEGLDKMEKAVAQRGPLNPQEQQSYQERKKQLEASREESRNMIQKFMENQTMIKKEMQAGATSEQMKRGPSQTGGVQTGHQQGSSSQAHSVSSAIDAARKSDDSESAKMIAQAAVNQTANAQKPAPPSQGASTQGKADERSQDQRMSTSQPSGPSHGSAPGHSYALNSDPTMQRAYSNQNVNTPFPQATSQNTPQGPPQQSQGTGNRADQQPASAHTKFNIQRDLHVPAPPPAPYTSSRPTLSNGPFSAGSVGQPVAQKHPAYVLEGEGERVLSKKKLEELVRQVTGSTGPDADDGETMSAEVEETLLQVADDFVDQVIVSACKLAKLRSSSTLELRDIQLILERNYNIRVPGYASDEIRAVRKVVPTPGWTQKLSAVQAAKVTAGKRE